jgi:hydrogenase maturation protease
VLRVVGCEPATLDEGIGLSPQVEAAVEPAIARIEQLIPELRHA